MDILSTSGINSLVENFRYYESYKRVDPLEAKKNKFTQLSSAWSSLDTKLNSFKNILKDFKEIAKDIF